MKSKRKSGKLCFTVCDVVLFFLMVFVSLNNVVSSEMSNDNQKILSRRRRYLIFPEGSSFQVVYETYQPIPGYANLLIFYLTQALAWELPYEAYHPEEHLQDLWDDVVFPNDQYDEVSVNNQNVNTVQIASANQIANDNQIANAAAYNLQNSIQNTLEDKNNPSANGNLNPKYAQNQQGAQFQNGNEVENNNRSRIGNQYYANNYNPGLPNSYYYSNYNQNPPTLSDTIAPLTKTISNKMDYYLSYADKVINQITDLTSEKHEPWTKTDWTTYSQRPSQPSYYTQQREANRKKFRESRNFIHPAFGKRSIDQINTPEEAFNLKYHRTSRQTMYQKIAKFLDSDEINGAECVLKALCETGKRRDSDKKPGPFLMEILRVIFSLPETNQKEVHPVYKQYDHAHSTSMDCDELFWKCKSNLWNKNEIFQ